MEINNGRIEGNRTIENELRLLGTMTGSATVAHGAVFELHGTVFGNVVVEEGGTARLYGTVSGDVTNKGGHLDVFGTIEGHLIKSSGTTHLDGNAAVGGGHLIHNIGEVETEPFP